LRRVVFVLLVVCLPLAGAILFSLQGREAMLQHLTSESGLTRKLAQLSIRMHGLDIVKPLPATALEFVLNACAKESDQQVAIERCLDGAEWLLEHGADPNVARPELGLSLLHIAVLFHDPRVVALLVEHGARATTLAAVGAYRGLDAYQLARKRCERVGVTEQECHAVEKALQR